MGTTKEFLITTQYDSQGIKKFVSDVEKAKIVAEQLGQTVSKSAKVIDQSITTTFDKNGRSVRNVTTQFDEMGKKSTVSFKEVEGSVKRNNAALSDFSIAAKKSEIDIGKLINRAIVTIPVWLALRSAIMGVFQGIQGGITNLISFDKALQAVKRNLTGTTEEINANFLTMKKEVTDFSLKTGISVEKISESIKNFATLGFNFKDSLTGGIEAVKLSTLLFGDAAETSKAFASSLNVLIDRSKGAASAQQQMADVFALTSQLAIKNKDDLGEITQFLNKFSSTALTAHLSINQVVALGLTLASAGKSGSEAGTLLSTTLQNMLVNIDKVGARFGLAFNPKNDSALSFLTKILDASEQLSKTPGGETLLFDRLADVLGGTRGTKVTTALIAMNKTLKENLSEVANVSKFHSDFENILNTEFKQAEILSNGLREMGKSFVTHLVGVDNFGNALKRLNETVQNLGPGMDAVAQRIGNFGKIITLQWGSLDIKDLPAEKLEKKLQANYEQLIKALRGNLPKEEMLKLQTDLKNGLFPLDVDVPIETLLTGLNSAITNLNNKVNTTGNKVQIKTEIDNGAGAVESLENELNELKAKLKAGGATDIELALLDVDFLQSKGTLEADKIRDAQSKIRISTIEKERSIKDALIKATEDASKAEGASNLQVIVRRIELEKQLGIERRGMDLLTQQLELQKALTEETKKTRQERLKELETLVKGTSSQFFGKAGTGTLGLDAREQALRLQAANKGISDEQINRILNPESQITGTASSLLRDLQNGLANPVTRSMGSLESAINDLTRTIMQQESSSTGATVPRYSPNVNGSYKGQKVLKPMSQEDVEKILADF